MEIYDVGVSLLDSWELDELREMDFKWVVYSYEVGYYEGSGEAVGLGLDGLIRYRNLGHCSCYGPLEGSWDVTTVEEFFREKDSILDQDFTDVVKAKVRSLMER